jgi:hypothetical protein
MRKPRPCLVCGKMTSKNLYKDKRLGLAVCSGKCEHQFVLTCDSTQQAMMLSCLDGKMKKARRDEQISWAAAGIGVILVLASLFASSALLFVLGVVMMGVGASSTRIFEERLGKLAMKRKRIVI